jgi:putative ABC transport system ATP-binding protein
MGDVAVKALNGVSLSVIPADFVAIVGPSGSGKTTLMNMIGLIDKPDSGDVIIESEATNSLSDNELTEKRLKTIGFIFQSFNLIPVLSVRENVELPMLLGKQVAKKNKRLEWVNELIERVGLSGWADHRPSELSGGQRQRVAIARALVNKPKLVLADEPTANLDSETGERILSEMKKFNKELGTTFIFSTHDMAIRDMADHVVQLKDGKIIFDSNLKA